MKTIFKRPLFVNPQAYTVIPELYSIDKLSSFNFDENDTYTTKLVYNGRIESIIKKAGEEYILHLDLYTVDGSCVLGEWYIKGIDSESVVTIDKNILTIVANNHLKYPGLIAAWSAKGKTNEDVDRNILKDLTGNGHDITLNNFAYSGMSGYGGYKVPGFNIYPELTINSLGYKKVNFSLRLDSSVNYKSLISVFTARPNDTMPSFKLRISGLKEDQHIGVGFHNYGSNIANNLGNGIHNIPSWTNDAAITSNVTINDDTAPRRERVYDNVTIELLPEYPDALVFDGVDDRGYNKSIAGILGNNPDYTIIVNREWIQHKSPSSLMSIANFSSSQFLFEHINNLGKATFSRGIVNYINYPEKISWQVFNSYNQQSIKYGTNPVNAVSLYLGCLELNQQYSNVAFYSAYLFNRTLDDQEIKSFIRKHIDSEYLLPSEIPATTLISNDTLIDNSTLIKNN